MSVDSVKARLQVCLAALGPRGGLVLLVFAHLVLAFLQAWPLPALIEQWTGSPAYWGLPTLLAVASEAVLQAQLALVGAYLMLGSGWLLVRLIRGPGLLLWLLLAYLAGSMWLDAGRDLRGFQESLGANFWTFCWLALPLFLYRIFRRRHVALGDSVGPTKVQFRILHLLLIITEAAALMAAIRALVPWERDWREQLWSSLRDYPFEFASYEMLALVMLAAVPAVILTLRLASLKRAALLLAAWQLLLSLAFVVYQALSASPANQAPWLENPALTAAERIGGHAVSWLHTAAFCFTAALVIWTTLALVRWIGYRLLPLPRRGGRHSSEATSAA